MTLVNQRSNQRDAPNSIRSCAGKIFMDPEAERSIKNAIKEAHRI